LNKKRTDGNTVSLLEIVNKNMKNVLNRHQNETRNLLFVAIEKTGNTHTLDDEEIV